MPSRVASLTAAITEELANLDPYGLRPGEDGWAPRNEYDLEARDLADLLDRHGSITTADVDRVWLHWFAESLSDKAGTEVVRVLARRLNQLL